MLLTNIDLDTSLIVQTNIQIQIDFKRFTRIKIPDLCTHLLYTN